VIAELVDEVIVMYAGKIVESAPVRALFADPQHPYTIGLLGSIPRLDVERERLGDDRRHGAQSCQPASRLPLRAPAAVCGCPLPRRAAAAARARHDAPGRLLEGAVESLGNT